MRIGLGMTIRLAHECRVCRQVRDEAEVGLVATDAALFGAAAYAICPACAMPVAGHTDRNYRRRADTFIKKRDRVGALDLPARSRTTSNKGDTTS